MVSKTKSTWGPEERDRSRANYRAREFRAIKEAPESLVRAILNVLCEDERLRDRAVAFLQKAKDHKDKKTVQQSRSPRRKVSEAASETSGESEDCEDQLSPDEVSGTSEEGDEDEDPPSAHTTGKGVQASERPSKQTLPELHTDRDSHFLSVYSILNDLDDNKAESKPAEKTEATAISKKRKAESEISICVQCQEPYYTNENDDKACLYHTGELYLDESSNQWWDWDDEDCSRDTVENREENPDGFIWECCDEKGSNLGCVRGRHKNINASRGRFASPPSSDEEWSRFLG
ncbi:hypothetical protein F5Y16DRAFT_111538 [Xylariaceae sp. FL0255]|nr:hypothetical protein F5Y16DRAFT_111538 [Xylariaceae sp. FL0255]